MKARVKPILLSLCSLLLVIAIAGCQIANPSATTTSTTDAQESTVSSDEQALDEQVFPKDKVVDVKITLDPTDFQDMLDNASNEEYKTATVEYNGVTMDNVAIRTKGNLSLRSVVQMTDSDRYSFKLSFDEYVNQNLFGLTKINLNNNYSDASYLREFLTYELAESVGLPTPKYSFVNVYVNDKLWGFYLAVEQIGDAYLERNFGNSYGALYKGIMTGQGSDLTWLGDDAALYTGLEMKSEKSNDDIVVDMLNELNNGTDYEKYIDVEESLKYIALNAVTGNTDSYLGSNKQNYYLYEDDGVFSILPWDYNMAFGGLGSSDTLIDEPTQGALAERPLIAKLLANDEYKAKYHEIISAMTTGYLQDETFQARIKELTTLISSYVKNDPSSFYTYAEYESGVTSVETFMSKSNKNIAQQLDGTIPSSGDGTGSGMGGGGMGGGGFGGSGMGGAAPGAAADTTTGKTAASAAQGATVVPVVAGGQAATSSQPAAGGQVATNSQPAAAGQAATDGQAPPAIDQGGFNGAAGGVPGAQGGPAIPDGGGMGNGDFGGGGGGGMGGGGFGGGMGGGDFGGTGATQPQGSVSEAVTTGIAIVVLLLSAAFITFYKRKRL